MIDMITETKKSVTPVVIAEAILCPSAPFTKAVNSFLKACPPSNG